MKHVKYKYFILLALACSDPLVAIQDRLMMMGRTSGCVLLDSSSPSKHTLSFSFSLNFMVFLSPYHF